MSLPTITNHVLTAYLLSQKKCKPKPQTEAQKQARERMESKRKEFGMCLFCGVNPVAIRQIWQGGVLIESKNMVLCVGCRSKNRSRS